LQMQIDELQLELGNEESRLKALRNKKVASADAPATQTKATTTINGNGSKSNITLQVEKERLLSTLNSKVRNVYDLCGFDASSKPSTLYMLSQLESKLEMLLQDIERMPLDYVIKAEKDKEKKRRELKRAQQQEQQEKQQEERNRRAIERSMQAPKKRNGPPVMYRSRLIRRELKNTGDVDDSKDNNDELKYLS